MVDFQKVPSPCYVLDEQLLDANLAKIDEVRRRTGAEIIVALKACAIGVFFPELARHSDGATASSAAEARLVFEEYGRPAHLRSGLYRPRFPGDHAVQRPHHLQFGGAVRSASARGPARRAYRAD